MSVGTYALATLADLKALLGLTDSDSVRDALLEQCIDRSTKLVEGVVGHPVKARVLTEWHDASGGPIVSLRSQPVNNVQFVGYCMRDALTIEVTGAVQSSASVTEEALTLSTFVEGESSTSQDVLPFSSNPTMRDLAAATLAAVVGASKSIVQVGDGESFQLVPGVYDLQNGAVTIPMVVANGCRFRLDRDTGTLHLRGDWEDTWDDDEYQHDRTGLAGPRGPRKICARYDAGYSTVPDEVTLACLEGAKTLWLNRSSDETKQSESLGDYSYSRGGGGDGGVLGAVRMARMAIKEALAESEVMRIR